MCVYILWTQQCGVAASARCVWLSGWSWRRNLSRACCCRPKYTIASCRGILVSHSPDLPPIRRPVTNCHCLRLCLVLDGLHLRARSHSHSQSAPISAPAIHHSLRRPPQIRSHSRPITREKYRIRRTFVVLAPPNRPLLRCETPLAPFPAKHAAMHHHDPGIPPLTWSKSSSNRGRRSVRLELYRPHRASCDTPSPR